MKKIMKKKNKSMRDLVFVSSEMRKQTDSRYVRVDFKYKEQYCYIALVLNDSSESLINISAWLEAQIEKNAGIRHLHDLKTDVLADYTARRINRKFDVPSWYVEFLETELILLLREYESYL